MVELRTSDQTLIYTGYFMRHFRLRWIDPTQQCTAGIQPWLCEDKPSSIAAATSLEKFFVPFEMGNGGSTPLRALIGPKKSINQRTMPSGGVEPPQLPLPNKDIWAYPPSIQVI
jgi:hypothetical protein